MSINQCNQSGLHCATANPTEMYARVQPPCPHPWPPDHVAITTTTIYTCYAHESINPATLSYGSWASTSSSSGCTPNWWFAVTGGWYVPSNSPPPAPEIHDTTPPKAPTSSTRCVLADSSSIIPRMLTRLLLHSTPGLCEQDTPASDLTTHMLRSHRKLNTQVQLDYCM